VPYDGILTEADGNGIWWEGLAPRELYAQNHEPAPNFMGTGAIHARWNWGDGATPPERAYCQAFSDRTVDLMNQTDPDLIYFDDTALPLWPVSDAGLKLAAHLYNKNADRKTGKTEAVLFGKILSEQQRRCMVWDIERGQSNVIEPQPWQADTCLGSWHYDRGIYDRSAYKSAVTVIRTVVDVVSKNGSLLLSVPVRSDGAIDEKERAIVEGIAKWMDVNRESIFGTRPWKVCGEGPQLASSPPPSAQGFNEGKGLPFTNRDIRYTQRGDKLYAFVMGRPDGKIHLTVLSAKAGLLDRKIREVGQLGGGRVVWQLDHDGLDVTPNLAAIADHGAPVVFRLALAGETDTSPSR
jgi:alpha-L-fucosidase